MKTLIGYGYRDITRAVFEKKGWDKQFRLMIELGNNTNPPKYFLIFLMVKITNIFVALNRNSQLLLNHAPCF
ncbi:MAG: hypothetical protein KAH18_02645 [Psychromonas sp.]|nr:hypothetical protein [Psychromonas sp.]